MVHSPRAHASIVAGSRRPGAPLGVGHALTWGCMRYGRSHDREGRCLPQPPAVRARGADAHSTLLVDALVVRPPDADVFFSRECLSTFRLTRLTVSIKPSRA